MGGFHLIERQPGQVAPLFLGERDETAGYMVRVPERQAKLADQPVRKMLIGEILVLLDTNRAVGATISPL